MPAPYTPSQLNLPNYDATQSATVTWLFSSSDTTVSQQSYQLQIYNNVTNVLVLDTGVVTSTSSRSTIPTSTLVNRTQYKWRIQYTDTLNNVSPWSSYQIFTCSSLPIVSITNPTTSQTIASNLLTIISTYSQAQSVSEQSYRIVLYSSDQTTIVQDSGTVYNTTNQLTVSGLSNGTYYVQVTVTSTDGLSASTGKIVFTISYTGSKSSASISTIPQPSTASIRVDWQNPSSVMGTYVGTGGTPTYSTGKFGQAVRVANYGEKVYYAVSAFTQFTYTSWWIPNLNSSAMTSNQVIVKLQANNSTFLQMRYDSIGQVFVFERYSGGSAIVAKSSTITFTSGQQIFIAIKQTSTATAYIGVNGTFYTISFPVDGTISSNSLGVTTYGTGTYASLNSGIVQDIINVYIGCTLTDGNEANALFDQTHLTGKTLTDSDIQSLYTNATLQQFNFQTIFLANFDSSLEGGESTILISYWNIYRVYNGFQKLIGTVTNTQLGTASYTDFTPSSKVSYQYNVVPVDGSGNTGNAQIIQGIVDFDGWWLSDTTTNTSFQFNFNLGDVALKTNYKRSQYETFGQYPIIVYAPMKYKSGKLTGWIADITNGSNPPIQQYQTLQTILDSHKQLLLRGETGWALVVDCYEPTNTLPSTRVDYSIVEILWTEVASL